MSQRLLQMMKQRIESEGPVAKLKMAAAIHKGERMIDRYLSGATLPRPEVARALAKECGANDKVALEIENESYLIRSRAKRTA